MIDNKFLESPEDSRDYIFEDLFTDNINIPLEYDPRRNLLPVRDQGGQGSCVAQSLAAIKEIQESKEIGFSEYLSPQFVYNLRMNAPSEGMYSRNAMAILKQAGILPEVKYPYSLVQKPENMNQELLEEAKNYRIKSYARIKTQDGIKKAILVNGAVMICVPVYSDIDPIWLRQNPWQNITGGHAMVCVGWSKGGFIIRNSWGGNFSHDKNGYCFMPFSHFDSIKDQLELWTVYDEESKPDPQFSKWYYKYLRGLKNIIKNLHSMFYLALFGFLVTLFLGFFDYTAWILNAIIVLGMSTYIKVKNSYLPKV